MAQAQALPKDDPFLSDFATAVIDGLGGRRKHIPCRFLYDARGSALFEDITKLEEYYPTRTEIGLLRAHADAIASLAGPDIAVIEFGSGSSRKTDILLDALHDVAVYVPIDISEDALAAAADRLRAKYPALRVEPLHADFTQVTSLPKPMQAARKLGFFPGSTIGNFGHAESRAFLANAGRLLGPGQDLLIGVDLKKDARLLVPAYDDARGVTATFSLNLLHRINRELGGNFDVDRFRHEARYNEEAGRIEIHLVSQVDQEVRVLGRRFRFTAGERVHTENSHKYSVAEFVALAGSAGWRSERVWTDAADLFSVHYLRR